jgi:hypothetical protein
MLKPKISPIHANNLQIPAKTVFFVTKVAVPTHISISYMHLEMGGGATLGNQSSVQEGYIKKRDRHHVDMMSLRDAIMMSCLVVGSGAETAPR